MRHFLLVIACLGLYSCVDDPVSPLPRMRQRGWSFEGTPDKYFVLGDYEQAVVGTHENGIITREYYDSVYHTWEFVVDQNGDILSNGTYKQTAITIYHKDTIWDSFIVMDVKDSYFVSDKGIYNKFWGP